MNEPLASRYVELYRAARRLVVAGARTTMDFSPEEIAGRFLAASGARALLMFDSIEKDAYDERALPKARALLEAVLSEGDPRG
jgi:hypothetical protein